MQIVQIESHVENLNYQGFFCGVLQGIVSPFHILHLRHKLHQDSIEHMDHQDISLLLPCNTQLTQDNLLSLLIHKVVPKIQSFHIHQRISLVFPVCGGME